MKNQVEAEEGTKLKPRREGFSAGRLTAKVDQSRRERERLLLSHGPIRKQFKKKKRSMQHNYKRGKSLANTSELVWLFPLIG